MRAEPAAVVLPCTLMSLAALGGSAGLASGGLDVGDRLPWGSPALAGVALLLVVGVPMGAAAWAGARRRATTGDLAVLAGGLLVGWIVVEVAVVASFSWLQPACLVYGLVVAGLGWSIRRRTVRSTP